ncbi:hypothetical protein QVD17_03536 [Tagetes erecta]|uniref:Uncharacterized protein n=1 Tax=Tagetes erecta TaxID=13708 RepID=A0AAD8LDR3_TARER|nr:hypothetical protein QVD17_03536 [Tagetes erecta]
MDSMARWIFSFMDEVIYEMNVAEKVRILMPQTLNGPKICIKVDKSNFFKTRSQILQAAKPTSISEPYMVYGFRNIGIELPVNHHRVLKAVSKVDQQVNPSRAGLTKNFESLQSSKRTVRRGLGRTQAQPSQEPGWEKIKSSNRAGFPEHELGSVKPAKAPHNATWRNHNHPHPYSRIHQVDPFYFGSFIIFFFFSFSHSRFTITKP